jgi:hypothetical protein
VYPAAKCLPCYPPVNLPRVGLPSLQAQSCRRTCTLASASSSLHRARLWPEVDRRSLTSTSPQYRSTTGHSYLPPRLPTYSLSAPPSQAASRAHPSLTNLVLLRQISPEPSALSLEPRAPSLLDQPQHQPRYSRAPRCSCTRPPSGQRAPSLHCAPSSDPTFKHLEGDLN